MFYLDRDYYSKIEKKRKIQEDWKKRNEMKSKLEAIQCRILIHLEDYSFQSSAEFSKIVLHKFLLPQY